ncbi:protein PTST homolog 2, chloroplastic isoform X2 [Hevea brasiliensis]|uniref:protein PTST homolog 2, chloroplastic isoform X2 n=1 Tax=Hevea brasiliensis TaxID=3981 RepID=UPI0025EA98F6|nr:protein PTST homolog 2, chloroplastic isoform X2 [Hevea brasiliensis]
MLSFTTAPTLFFVSLNSFIDLSPYTFPFPLFEGNSRKKEKRLMSLQFIAVKDTGSTLGFVDVKKRNYSDCCWSCAGFVRRCKKDWESDGDFALEAEILEFMKNSDKPEAFPSKKELIDAGRMDLVEDILKQGGWLASGWDLEDSLSEGTGVLYNGDMNWDLITDKECKNAENVLNGKEERSTEVSSCSPASSSGRSLETAAVNDSGIEGILSRLEKERNMNFGFGLREKAENTYVQSNGLEHNLLAKSSKIVAVADFERNNRPASSNLTNGTINDSESKFSHSTSPSNIDGFRNSLKPDSWRTWSIKRAGFSEMEFEVDAMDAVGDEMLEKKEGATAPLNRRKDNCSHGRINSNEIRSCLQHLEAELSSVLNMLKSNTSDSVTEKVHESASDDLLKLSDAWEFQENEVINAQAKLRSIRAKLAVLDGKMALAIIDAQKIVEEKQKRVDIARRALRLLRTACIVWPNSASEVLLAGSFDGWATKRKMQKSSTGVFSLYMKLYPGRYEIKFIVDGEWRIDPLRPIVLSDGYENNLLIIT